MSSDLLLLYISGSRSIKCTSAAPVDVLCSTTVHHMPALSSDSEPGGNDAPQPPNAVQVAIVCVRVSVCDCVKWLQPFKRLTNAWSPFFSRITGGVCVCVCWRCTLRAAHANRHPSTTAAASAPYSCLLGNTAIMVWEQAAVWTGVWDSVIFFAFPFFNFEKKIVCVCVCDSGNVVYEWMSV